MNLRKFHATGQFLLKNKLKKCQKDISLKQIVILPYFREEYICFSCNRDYSFEELINLFLQDDDAEEIGAISVIAESYPYDLYKFISNNNYLNYRKLKFIFDYVVPGYLPLVLPRERLMDYEFNEEFLDNTWVKILLVIRSYLRKLL